MCRQWGALEHSVLSGMSLSNSILQDSKKYADEDLERLLEPQGMDNTKETVSSPQQDWCTYEVTDIIAAWIGTIQVQARRGSRVENGQELPSLIKKLSLSLLLTAVCKGKIHFLSECTNYMQWQAPYPAVGGQYKINSVVFWRLFFDSFCFVWTFLSYWSLFVYYGSQSCVFYGFCLCMRVSCVFALFFFPILFVFLFCSVFKTTLLFPKERDKEGIELNG